MFGALHFDNLSFHFNLPQINWIAFVVNMHVLHLNDYGVVRYMNMP